MVPPPLPPPSQQLPPLCTLPQGPGPPRFVCYYEEEEIGADSQGGFSLYVTDATELWSACFTSDSLATLKARFGLHAAEDISAPFRTAFKQQAVTFTPQEDRASLTLASGPSALDFQLSKVPGPEAASRLQALTLGLAARVCSLELQLAYPDSQKGCPGPRVRRPCPGESLINPGFKRKKPASGVDFDDL